MAFGATLNRLALFAQDEWSITPKWSVYLGLRWEGLDTRSQGNTFNAIRNRSHVLSPLFQTLWKLPDSNDDQIRLAVTRTYKAPGINRLIPRPYTVSNNSAVSPDFQGNPNLKPELATGVDLAYEHFFGEGAMLSASVYRRTLSDFTRTDVSLVGQRWLSTPINDGQAQAQGLELDAKLPLQVVWGKQAPALDLRANMAFNASSVSTVPGPNNRMADQTPFSGNIGLDYKPNAGFSGGGSYTFKRGGPVQISETSSTYKSARRDMDVYTLWKLSATYQLRVSATNVLAQPHINVAQYSDSNGSLRNTGVAASTATLRATLEIKL
jgi:outer membrane receptor protein involved in Fe transport